MICIILFHKRLCSLNENKLSPFADGRYLLNVPFRLLFSAIMEDEIVDIFSVESLTDLAQYGKFAIG